MARERVVSSKPRCADGDSTDERVRVRQLMRDAGGAHRPGLMATIDAAHECEWSAAVVVDDGTAFFPGEGVMCALGGEASCAWLKGDAPRFRFEVCVAVWRSGSGREPQTDNGSVPWRLQTDDRRGDSAIVAPARVSNDAVEEAAIDVVGERVGAWLAGAGCSLDDSKVAPQVPVGGERRHVGDDRRTG